MLWQADAALAHRDPALPGLATLLSPTALTAHLQTALAQSPTATGARLCHAAPYYVRYKAGTNCLVAYQLQTEAGPLYLHGVALPAADEAKARKQIEGANPSILGPGALYLEEKGLLLTLFPNDRRLQTLPRLGDKEERQRLWQRLAPEHPALATAPLTPLRYKPERRFVARLDPSAGAPDGRAFLLRLYTAENYTTALANQRAFAGNEQVRIAQIVGRSERRGALLLEWLPGRPLDTMLGGAEGMLWSALYGAGQALAALHTARPTLPVHYTPAAEGQALDAAVAAIGELLPACVDRLEALQAHLHPLLAHATTPVCAIHGDFSADQVLWQEMRNTRQPRAKAPVALLDLDRAGYGTPAADLGSFLAHLHQLELCRRLSAAQRRAMTTQLLAGYRDSAPTVPTAEEMEVHTAVRLLRLAPDAFRQRWSAEWPTYTRAVIARVETILHK